MKLYIGADHSGVDLKEEIKAYLKRKGHSVVDVGSFAPASADDYPDFAEKVALGVKKGRARGILICRTGTGMVIAANKIPGIRAVLALDEYSARKSREDNDANVLTVRNDRFPHTRIPRIIAAWLAAKPDTHSRHKRRIAKITKLERKYR